MKHTTSFPDGVSIWQGDLTTLEFDAIVNAANSSLLGGGGVDGAIHGAAGPQLVAECRMLHGCKTGQAKITGGHRLPAKHVIHTVGPVWNGGDNGEAQLLADCYTNSLKVASENGLTSIAFPAISCGIYRFPVDQACTIAIRAINAFAPAQHGLNKVVLVAYSTDMYQQLQAALHREHP